VPYTPAPSQYIASTTNKNQSAPQSLALANSTKSALARYLVVGRSSRAATNIVSWMLQDQALEIAVSTS
jgi:hypothetical protein